MATQRTKFMVGLFLAVGIGIALFAFIWLGISGILKTGDKMEVYFDESVQGLEIDSPVKYRGVAVGRVESIGVAQDADSIHVILKIDTDADLEMDVIAQLKSVGITGTMFVELDKQSPSEMRILRTLRELYDERKALEGAEREEMDRRIDQLQDRVYSPDVRTANRIVIPSKPSEIGQIMRGIAEAVEQIKKIDFEAISDNINEVLNEVQGKVADANIKGISDGVIESLDRVKELLDKEKIDRILAASEEAAHALNNLLDDADRAVNRVEATVNRVDGIVASKEAAIKAAVDEFKKAISNANDVLEKGKTLIGNTDGSLGYLSRSLMVTAQNLERASDNLNRTLEKVSNQPSQLLFGQPPPPREVEQDIQQ